ncbi:hypothetical protein DAI22_01g180150 [Oryza sativa Japonica Group]|nr:hypothetical protein DAI22_01g180150 [Oryza sativa Japonica Group]KAF2950336.1 hypothetical protein DAI22_01g180150 [Oryza sativa Japonica Group]
MTKNDGPIRSQFLLTAESDWPLLISMNIQSTVSQSPALTGLNLVTKCYGSFNHSQPTDMHI